MRLALAALVLVTACAHVGASAHSGRDRSPEGARAIRDRQEGIVTARGGDRADWYTFTVDRPCTTVELEVEYAPARPGMKVHVLVHGPGGRLEHRRRVQLVDAPLGHYYVQIAAVGDGAATYQLKFANESRGFECGDLPPLMPVWTGAPPDGPLPPPPPGMLTARISSWARFEVGGRVGYRANVDGGAEDGIDGGPASLLAPDGTRIAEPIFVSSTGAHEATVIVEGDRADLTRYGAVAVQRPFAMPPPLDVDVTDVFLDHGAVALTLDRAGRFDGVEPGWRGQVFDGDDVWLGNVEVVEVAGRHATAHLEGVTLESVLGAHAARIAPPEPQTTSPFL